MGGIFCRKKNTMDTQCIVTYQIVDSLTGERLDVSDHYQAQYYYEKGDHVTEIHTTITQSPPFNRTIVQVATIWHDNDSDNASPDPEIEEE